MPTTVVVGGQYGSEGKGKVVSLTAALKKSPWVVRCGGPNSGHTVNISGQERVLQQLPAAVSHPNAMLFVSAGCVVDEDLLLQEVALCDIDRDRLVIDPRAVLVTDADREAERSIANEIGSTASGTGHALIRRMSRTGDVCLACDSRRLCDYARIETVAPLLHEHLDKGGDVIVEGTQGFGLSLLHSPYYPYVTSRDTTAAGFCAEVGLSPRQVDEIIMVMRTFPIRVGGSSGELRDELSWDDVREISGSPIAAPEYTSVTKRLRRVARFDMQMVYLASRYNRPTALAVMGLDRLNHVNYGARHLSCLTPDALGFLRQLEVELMVPVHWAGTGFGTFDVIGLHGRDGMGGKS